MITNKYLIYVFSRELDSGSGFCIEIKGNSTVIYKVQLCGCIYLYVIGWHSVLFGEYRMVKLSAWQNCMSDISVRQNST